MNTRLTDATPSQLLFAVKHPPQRSAVMKGLLRVAASNLVVALLAGCTPHVSAVPPPYPSISMVHHPLPPPPSWPPPVPRGNRGNHPWAETQSVPPVLQVTRNWAETSVLENLACEEHARGCNAQAEMSQKAGVSRCEKDTAEDKLENIGLCVAGCSVLAWWFASVGTGSLCMALCGSTSIAHADSEVTSCRSVVQQAYEEAKQACSDEKKVCFIRHRQ